MENIKKIKIRKFSDLISWQEAHKLVLMIYKITKNFPNNEQYGIVMQLRRAVISITSNIVEGFTRKSYREKIRFYYMAISSLVEVQSQIVVSRDIDYIDHNDFNQFSKQSIFVSKLINGLIKGAKKKL